MCLKLYLKCNCMCVHVYFLYQDDFHLLIILTEVKALFLNGGQQSHPSTHISSISRMSTEKLIQEVRN